MAVMTKYKVVASLIFAGCLHAGHASAQVSVTYPFLQWFNEGPHNLNLGFGYYLRFGAESVIPNLPPTTGTAVVLSNGLTFPMPYPISDKVTPNWLSEL